MLTQQGAPLGEGPSACVPGDAHRFDFWPGRWEVESRRRGTNGAWHETQNLWRATEVLGGCTFIDFADGDFGTGPLRGMGTRYYDPATGHWYITWMSTESPGVMQVWEGGFDSTGRGEFISRLMTANGPLLSRILWWDVLDHSAEWEHAISSDDGTTWLATWRMSFRRAEDPESGPPAR